MNRFVNVYRRQYRLSLLESCVPTLALKMENYALSRIEIMKHYFEDKIY